MYILVRVTTNEASIKGNLPRLQIMIE